MRIIFTSLLLLTLLAGCGADDRLSKEQYEREVQAAFQRDAERPLPDTLAEDPLERADALEEAKENGLQLAQDLERIEPPPEVAEAHDDLVSATRQRAESRQPLIDALRRGDRQEIKRRLQGSSSSLAGREQAEAAFQTFEEHGYDVHPPPPP